MTLFTFDQPKLTVLTEFPSLSALRIIRAIALESANVALHRLQQTLRLPKIDVKQQRGIAFLRSQKALMGDFDDDAPDLQVGPLSLWALGRSSNPSPDPWSVDDVCCHVVVSDAGVVVDMRGVIPSRIFSFFLEKLSCFHQELEGEIFFDGSDMGVVVALRSTTLGHVQIEASLHIGGVWRHPLVAGIELDQTYLPEMMRQCRAVLERFPVLVPLNG